MVKKTGQKRVMMVKKGGKSVPVVRPATRGGPKGAMTVKKGGKSVVRKKPSTKK